MPQLPYYLATARDENDNAYRLYQMGHYWYAVQSCDTDETVNLTNTPFEEAFEFLNGIGTITSTRWDS